MSEDSLFIYIKSLDDVDKLAKIRKSDKVVIDSSVVGLIIFEKPWRLSILLRDGRKIVVESDIYEDASNCKTVECIYENTYLNRWIED